MKRSTVLGAALLSLMLLVSGCGGAKQQASNETDKPATGETGKPSGADTAAKPAATGTSAPAQTQPAGTQPTTGTATRYVLVAGESKASYEVKEVFLIEALNATAVGTSTAIKGDLVVENGAFKPSTVVVDVTQLKSNRPQRDGVLRNRGLETAKYPTAEFTIAAMEGGPLAEGKAVPVKLTGKAKIHGVEQDLTWEGTAKLEGDTLRLTASVQFKMDLFNIEPPNIADRIRVDDNVKLMVEFVAKKG